MFKKNLIAVWIGILILSGMFLMGQESWPPLCTDLDGDGYGDPVSLFCPHHELDCDDSDAEIYPGRIETPYYDLLCNDGEDNDCDGYVDDGDEGCRNIEPQILSAFFGLDNALPTNAELLCTGATGQDGMPIVMSHEIDQSTLQPDDFLVITSNSEVHVPLCATLAPGWEENEDRSILLIGEFGNADIDPPARVEIVSSLWTEPDGPGGPQDLNGLTMEEITPLEAGPFLVWAEVLREEEWDLGSTSIWTGGGCPQAGTLQVVRSVWAGGVTKPNGGPIDDVERVQFRVIVEAEGGGTEEIIPFAIADLIVNDNNQDLCLDDSRQPLRIEVPAGLVVDPGGDLNPATSVDVY
jgi:hypothetical protein